MKLPTVLLFAGVCALSGGVFADVRPLTVDEAPFPLTISVWEPPAREFSLADYGAKPDGELVTEAMERALDACAAAGGGRVRIPAGRWVSGAFRLKSNVAICLDDGAELHFTDDPVKCMRAPLRPDGRPTRTHRGLIEAAGCTNVAILGRGVLSCATGYWHDNYLKNPQRGFPRPQFFHIGRSKNIRFEGFKIRGSPAWTLSFELCEDIVLRDLDSVCTGPNTDGLDFTSCNRALVERCSLDQTDDAYTIKSGSGAGGRKRAIPTQNVVIRDCRAVHAHALLAIGSEVSGGIRNIYMTRCEVSEECWRWLFVKTNSRRGAFVENIIMENVRGRCATQGICEIEMFYDGNPNKELNKQYKESYRTRIEGVHVRNVVCSEANWAVRVRGDTNLPPTKVTVENVRVGRINNSLVKITGADDVKIKDVVIDPFVTMDPARLPSYAQTFEAEFADEAQARAAEAAFAPLPGGARLAFATRWDDTTSNHLAKAAMLERAGVKGNFYLDVRGDRALLAKLGKTLAARGHAIGNHTLSHPFMLTLSANAAFREIMAGRVALECAIGKTVNAYASPFGWYGKNVFRDNYRKRIAQMLVESGHWVSGDNPVNKVYLDSDVWMPAHRFSADDRNPQEQLFMEGLKRETALAEKDAGSPRVTLGTHSWCDEAGNARQEQWLKTHCVRPDWVQLNDLEYGAYRYSAVFGAVRKTRTQGKKAFFEVRRFDPAALGDEIALSLVFTNGVPVSVAAAGKRLAAGANGTWLLPHAEGRHLARTIALAGADGRSAAVPGVGFTVEPDDAKGVLRVTIVNDGALPLQAAHVIAHLAPAHCTRVQAFDVPVVAPGGKVVKELEYGVGAYAKGCADFGFDKRYYAASLDFTRSGARERLWAEAAAREYAVKPLTPADAACYVGPVAAAAADDAKLLAFTAGTGPLPDVGKEWQKSGYPGAVWYAVGAKPHRRGADEVKAAEGAVELYAVQFEAGKFDAVKMRVSAPIKDKKNADYFLNGEKFRLHDLTYMLPVKPGVNRLVIRTSARKDGYYTPAYLALYTWSWGSPVTCIPFK